MGKKEFVMAIGDFVKRLGLDFDIKKVILFGSRATKEYGEESDVDLIIVSNDFNNMDFFERAAKMYDYWKLDLPVDFICYTKKEFEKLKKRISIVKEALTNGIIIH